MPTRCSRAAPTISCACLFFVFAAGLPACGSANGTGATEVESTVPVDGATDVSPATPIVITFTAAMDTAKGTLRLNPGFISLPKTWSDGDRSLIATPDAPLDPETTYTVVGTKLVDAGGSEVADFEITFTTGSAGSCLDDTLGPQRLEPDPTVTLAATTSTAVVLVFNEPVTGVDTTSVTISGDNDARVVMINGADASWTVTITDLIPGNSYTLSLGSGIADACGNVFYPDSIALNVSCDTIAPQVKSSAGHAVTPGTIRPYELIFSEPVVSVPLSVLSLTAEAGNTGTDTGLSINANSSTSYTVTLFASDWAIGDSFTLTVLPGVTDGCGNPFAGPFAVAIEVIDCGGDTSAPSVTSAATHLHHLAMPQPYVLTFDEPVYEVAASSSLTPGAGAVGTDTAFTMVGGADRYEVLFSATDWAAGDSFNLVVGTGVEDLCGNGLGEAFVATIDAGDLCLTAAAPTLLEPSSVTLLTAAPSFDLVFDSPVIGVSTATLDLQAVTGTGFVDAVGTIDTMTYRITFADIANGDSYTLVVDGAGIVDTLCALPLAGTPSVPITVAGPGTGSTCDDPFRLNGLDLPHQEIGVFDDTLVDPASCSSTGDANVMWAVYVLEEAVVQLTLTVTQGGSDNTWPVIAAFTSTAANICNPANRTELDCDSGGSTATLALDATGLSAGDAIFFMIHGDGASYVIEDPIIDLTVAGCDDLTVQNTYTYPEVGATNVPVDTTIMMTFDNDLDPAAGTIDITADGTSVAGSPFAMASPGPEFFAYLSAGSLVIVPSADLPPGAAIEVSVDLVDAACGNAVQESFGFETAGGGPSAENCADPILLDSSGTTEVSWLTGADLDLLDASLASCVTGFAGTGDSVFQLEAAAPEVFIGVNTSQETVAVLLDACDSSGNVTACAVSSPYAAALGLLATGLTPGSTYFLVLGDTGSIYSAWPNNSQPVLTLVPSATNDGDGEAQITDGTGATGTASLPVVVDYVDEESGLATDVSYRRIQIPGATRIAVFGHHDTEELFDYVYAFSGSMALAYFGWGEKDFGFAVEADTAIVYVYSNASVSSTTDADLDGYTITAITYE